MKTQVNFDALGGGGDLTFTDGGTTSPITVDANHRYAVISIYHNATITVTLNGVTVTPTYTESGNFYVYIIPNVKAGDIITMTLGIGRVFYID